MGLQVIINTHKGADKSSRKPINFGGFFDFVAVPLQTWAVPRGPRGCSGMADRPRDSIGFECGKLFCGGKWEKVE